MIHVIIMKVSIFCTQDKTTMIVTPASTRVDVNATAFLGCQASYDSKQKDLVYVWDIFGRQINYALEPHYMQVSSNELMEMRCQKNTGEHSKDTFSN